MQIVVKKKVLEELVDKVVKEVSSFHSVRIDEIPAKIDEEDVIKPTEEMSTQLSQQKPKVDDPNYKPVNTSELSKAAAAIAEKVPQDKTEAFYKRLKDLAQQASDNKDEEQLSEARLDQIVSYLVGKPVRVNEAKKSAAIDPRSPEGIVLDTQIKASDASVDAFTDSIERLDRAQHPASSLARMAPMTMRGVYVLFDAIAKKRGEQFKRPSDLAGVKDELLQQGAITLSDDLRKMKLRAKGTTVEVGGFGVALHNVTKEEMLSAAEAAIKNYFDMLVEFITTGHMMGDPTSGIKREREGTLRTEASDVAKEVLIKLGEQLPETASVPEATMRNFADEIGDFIENDLSPENNQFSFTFTDLVIKVKKGKKGEEAAEEDEDAAEVSSEKQVVIDLTQLAQDIQSLPTDVGLYTRGDMTAIGQEEISRVNTAKFFKENVAIAIATAVNDLLNKFVKVKGSKFAAGDEGRNLASDILRRMGGARSDVDPATVNLALQDPTLTGITPDDTPEQIAAKQFKFLFKSDILSRDRFEMREQLFNAFMTDFFNPAVFMASKQFENSRDVSVQFQRAASINIGQVDDATKGGLPYEIYSMYMTLLKQFGDKQARIPFFRKYNEILNNPEFSQFVSDISGKTGLSDLSRSKESFFDKDTTLILVINLASEFAKKRLRQDAAAAILTGKSGEENGEFNVARAFGRFCEQEIIEAAEDGVPDAVKMIDKVADLMEESGMGFIRAKKKKGAGKVNEIAKLRSMIRKALR